MSQLTQNTADLDALIAKANALPDAGSGGGSVETCTVVLQFSSEAGIYEYCYSFLGSDNKVTTSYVYVGVNIKGDTYQLDNVVCGSLLYIRWQAPDEVANADYSVMLNNSIYYWRVCQVNGATDTIYFTSD